MGSKSSSEGELEGRRYKGTSSESNGSYRETKTYEAPLWNVWPAFDSHALTPKDAAASAYY
jgi:hypothetical protein